ncbi:MAG TPA: aromatic ring-hydroxylating dioxygenase subunit alpha [Gemmatimonadales bacterium]|nr:aromatic ring-hydroxylating dioxygenase subunit alpha [Gemmatimonadales bacterium]
MTQFLKTTQIAIGGARTLPRRYYVAPEVLAAEFEQIFMRRWLCVGREDQIREPGQYFLQQIGPESIIVLRDRGGIVRAYYNVCRHRGTRLCEAHAGRFSETIQCPYHAWTYSLDGRLIGAPSSADIEGFSKSDYPLHSVWIESWEGFLFINLAEEPEAFSEAYQPLIGRFSRFNLPKLAVARTIEYEVRANWKLLFQNYSECYHCGPVHPPLAKLTPPTSGENDLIEGPFTGGFMVINEDHQSLTMSGRSCGLMVGDLPEEDLNRVYYYAIFPNMLLSLHPDYVMFHTLWPEAPDRTRIYCSWLFHPATLGDPTFNPDDGVEFWDMTNRQDWHICEQSQLGVQSRAYRPGPYSKRESLSVQFDREVLKSLGSARAQLEQD